MADLERQRLGEPREEELLLGRERGKQRELDGVVADDAERPEERALTEGQRCGGADVERAPPIRLEAAHLR